MSESIKEVSASAQKALKSAKDAQAAESVWREYAGKRGVFRKRLRELKKLPPNRRAAEGRAVHQALQKFEAAAKACLAQLKAKEEEILLRMERLDVTLSPMPPRRGTLHPLTIVRRRAGQIFRDLGFSVVDGPEVEDAWHNFDALNIPENHPARDLWDTFWLKAQTRADKTQKHAEKSQRSSASSPHPSASKQQLLLRTHTSPVQIRYMETHEPPFRIIVPGEVYRYEATDASHEAQFMQLEGLMVERRNTSSPVTMKTLLSVLTLFFERFFEKPVALRMRPTYFPFVKPGIEVELSCIVCSGQGCPVCKQTGWLEMLGAGMVHPKVFDAVGYNPKHLQGFAFGFGLDRLAMLKYRIPDIRLFRSGDVRFLKQFLR